MSSPDLVALWRVVQRLQMAQVAALASDVLWQITERDWQAINRLTPAGQVGFDMASGRPTLFEVPVVLVASEAGRWPELVLVVDRRV